MSTCLVGEGARGAGEACCEAVCAGGVEKGPGRAQLAKAGRVCPLRHRELARTARNARGGVVGEARAREHVLARHAGDTRRRRVGARFRSELAGGAGDAGAARGRTCLLQKGAHRAIHAHARSHAGDAARIGARAAFGTRRRAVDVLEGTRGAWAARAAIRPTVAFVASALRWRAATRSCVQHTQTHTAEDTDRHE